MPVSRLHAPEAVPDSAEKAPGGPEQARHQNGDTAAEGRKDCREALKDRAACSRIDVKKHGVPSSSAAVGRLHHHQPLFNQPAARFGQNVPTAPHLPTPEPCRLRPMDRVEIVLSLQGSPGTDGRRSFRGALAVIPVRTGRPITMAPFRGLPETTGFTGGFHYTLLSLMGERYGARNPGRAQQALSSSRSRTVGARP